MIRTFLILIPILVSGCATYTGAALQVGGGLEDDVLSTAVAVKCKAASVGAIMRRYGSNFKVWSDECITPQPEVNFE